MIEDDYTLRRSGVTPAEVASALEGLAAANVVRIEALSENYAYYHLTQPGREWLNAIVARRRKRDAQY